MKTKKNPRIAIVTDWMTSRGGAERVVSALADLYPNADILTSVYDPSLFPEFKTKNVHTSVLQKLPLNIRHKHQMLLPFFPSAFKYLNTKPYDILISSCSAFAKCIKIHPHQKHICYCHTPTRYLYHAKDEYVSQYPLPLWTKPFKWILPHMFSWLEKSDQKAVQKIDLFIANSDYVGKRIQKYYQRKSQTLYPCIDTRPFIKASKKQPKKDYFLALGRFIPYKKFDLLIEAFKKNGLTLKLAGKGPELERCKTLAKGYKNIEFLGFIGDKELPKLYSEARAFLFPAEEDFGLTPVEAMSSGTPVIYYAKGGAVESVGESGFGFNTQTVEGVQEGIDIFLKQESHIKTEYLIKRGQVFDEKAFQKNIDKVVQNILKNNLK